MEDSSSHLTTSHRAKTFLAYTVMIGLAAAVFLLIRSWGEHLTAPGVGVSPGIPGIASHATTNTLLHVLLALAAVIVTARVMGVIFGYLQQPPVIGEVIGGILLGPSLLGQVAPTVSQYILPTDVAPFLSIIAQLGVILFMFLVGLELDLRLIFSSGHATLAISHASIIVPFLLGSTLALWLYPVLGTGDVHFTVFALFMGVSLSVTAFPVLARILTDRGISKSRMGAVALTCAAVDDATAWCLLAFVVSVAQAQLGNAVRTVVLTILFIAFGLVVLRALMAWLLPYLEHSVRLTKSGMTVIFLAMLLSALATEYIGIHAIFGAFLLGAIIPSQSKIAADLTHRLEDVISVLFLPVFFAFTGMRTQIQLISGWDNWMLCGLITLVACAGKFGGTLIAARLSGLDWRDSSALGILMNTRGLVELIVLNIGLDMHVITPTLFAMLVIMALVTTFMTSPILHWIIRDHPWVEETHSTVVQPLAAATSASGPG